MSRQKDGAEDGLGQDVQDTIEGSLAIWGDDIATLAETPGDGVEEPEEDGPYASDEVNFANVRAQMVGMLAGGPSDSPGDHEEGEHAKGPVAPLSN